MGCEIVRSVSSQFSRRGGCQRADLLGDSLITYWQFVVLIDLWWLQEVCAYIVNVMYISRFQ